MPTPLHRATSASVTHHDMTSDTRLGSPKTRELAVVPDGRRRSDCKIRSDELSFSPERAATKPSARGDDDDDGGASSIATSSRGSLGGASVGGGVAAPSKGGDREPVSEETDSNDVTVESIDASRGEASGQSLEAAPSCPSGQSLDPEDDNRPLSLDASPGCMAHTNAGGTAASTSVAFPRAASRLLCGMRRLASDGGAAAARGSPGDDELPQFAGERNDDEEPTAPPQIRWASEIG